MIFHNIFIESNNYVAKYSKLANCHRVKILFAELLKTTAKIGYISLKSLFSIKITRKLNPVVIR